MIVIKMAPRKADPDYFKFPNVFVMFIIAFGMTLTAMCVYVPEKIPYHFLGFLGDLAWYLAYKKPRVIEAIWYSAVAIHVSEAIYAYYLAGQKGIRGYARIKWFIFTLCFGIGTLGNLLKYDPNRSSIVNDLLHEFSDDKEHVDTKARAQLVRAIEVNDSDVKKLAI